MKKKTKRIVMTVMISLMACIGLFATPWIQLGAIADYGVGFNDDDFIDGLGEIENYGFGAEARINLFNWVSIDVPATFSFGDDVAIATRPSLNINIPVASFLDIAVGMGTELGFQNAGETWTMNGVALDKGLDALKASPLFYRGALTANIGFLSVGLSAAVPTKGTFTNFDMAPLWESTRVSASLLLNIL